MSYVFFTWSDSFVTHLPSVDTQHLRLVELINQLGEIVIEGKKIDAQGYEAACQALLLYAQEHFSDEEAHMERCAVDARHLDVHRAAHAEFVGEARMLIDTPGPINASHVHLLLNYLTHWLAYHILGVDQSMARQVRAIQAGVSPSEAYEQDIHNTQAGTEPLLNALNGLLQTVSARNAELRALNRDLEERVQQRTADLEYANRQLQIFSSQDDLTNLPNRRFAVAALKQLWAEAQRYETPLAVLMLDADRFKPVNDRFGHAMGDTLLCQLALRLRDAVRASDIVCRIGGDEFLVICPRSNRHGAAKAAQKILSSSAPLLTPEGDPCWDGSVSIGVAEMLPSMATIDDLLKAADQALYLSKGGGGGRLTVTPE
ncbi:MAG: diguanylate cyclase [Burkholderiaceae bacterium]|nr:diguanylate cyclase [Burkholderiaceae bacterium]